MISTNPNPLVSPMGEHGLPGVLVAAHRRAQREAPSNAKSYTVAYSFVDRDGKSVEGPTPTVRTIVRYYQDYSGRNKVERKRFGSSLIAVNAVMVVALTLLVVMPVGAQRRRDPSAVLDTVTYRVDRTIYSVDRITGTINRLRKRKQAKPPATTRSVQCTSGDGTTRPRRACG